MGATFSLATISLFSYMQSNITDEVLPESSLLPQLSCVFSFLSTVETILIGALDPGLGVYIDKVFNESGGPPKGSIRPAIRDIAGVQVTVMIVLIVASTLWPRGALSLNPSRSELKGNVEGQEEKKKKEEEVQGAEHGEEHEEEQGEERREGQEVEQEEEMKRRDERQENNDNSNMV